MRNDKLKRHHRPFERYSFVILISWTFFIWSLYIFFRIIETFSFLLIPKQYHIYWWFFKHIVVQKPIEYKLDTHHQHIHLYIKKYSYMCEKKFYMEEERIWWVLGLCRAIQEVARKEWRCDLKKRDNSLEPGVDKKKIKVEDKRVVSEQ